VKTRGEREGGEGGPRRGARSGEQLRRRHERDLPFAAARADHLGAVEEEEPVFDERPADGVAELVRHEVALRDAERVVLKTIGREFAVAVELEE
jgi:nucleotide-binding universal stress UspA family protein